MKSAAEVINFTVPAIIDVALFERVQNQLQSRNPKTCPPRVVTGPILLTGLAKCAQCGGSMTLRTGTSGTGKVHRYYTCCTSARIGREGCKGISIPMDRLDHLVTQTICERILTPEHLSGLLKAIIAKRSRNHSEVKKRVDSLTEIAADAENKIKRLYTLVENGLVEVDAPLKDRLQGLRDDRERARDALARITIQVDEPPLDEDRLATFSRLIREKLRTGDVSYRKAYIRGLLDTIEVGHETIRLRGSKSALERAILTEQTNDNVVRSLVQELCGPVKPRQPTY